MTDRIEKIGRSIVQHGSYNRRAYLMKLYDQDVIHILPALDCLAHDNHYEKILAKVPSGSKTVFERQGYIQEAVIPGYFNNREHAFFMCKYLSSGRRQITGCQKIQEILSLAKQQGLLPSKKNSTQPVNIRICGPEDVGKMSRVFKSVFKTYPFPIFDADYLATVIKNKQAIYFCMENGRQINAIAASEIDSDNKGVEMTDFATLPGYRGQGLAGCLLEDMERAMKGQGMKTAFSIARALSPGMNILFAKKGYAFGGTLANNTQISGHIESMNVWYKSLGASLD
ncbi:MAG: putative beta-lysine N-acetyltransferase [Desulfobacterales bacterium]|nr:putative beta-lysine N-acetyltransferase [Desulfobacterales bacterium]MDX2511608.1 putative beta-lysine N-acetyltransferase [Desulfobacterales bacterium]